MDRGTIASLISGSLYEDPTPEQRKFCDHVAGLILKAEVASTPSPLAPVEAGRGEREAWLRREIRNIEDSDEYAHGFPAVHERLTKLRNELDSLDAAYTAALSRRTGGEAVGWHTDRAPVGVPVEIRMPVSYGWWKATAKRHHYPDEEEGRYPNEFWEILHYNGEALLKVFYGSPKLEWRDSTAPSSPPEGVREALDHRQKWDLGMEAWRAYHGSEAFFKGGQTRQSSFVDGYIAALSARPTTPSRGLVDAAEWCTDVAAAPYDTRLIAAWHDSDLLPPHIELAVRRASDNSWRNTYGSAFGGSPTHYLLPPPLSAKPTVTADGGRDG